MTTSKKIISLFFIYCSLTLIACGQQSNNKHNTKNKMTTSRSSINNTGKENNPYYSHTDTNKLTLSDAEWKKILPPNVYEIARHQGTESAFTGKLWNFEGKGTYYCAACGNSLFRSDAKFASSCGWPSFFEQINPKSIVYKQDNSHGMIREEALCGRCGGHLGHLFNDGPPPTEKRYCMNSAVLDFEPDNAPLPQKSDNEIDTITFGAGCFWCVEAIFQDLKGVANVVSGYAGGTVKNPSYKEVCTGKTGHAEVCQITYNPKIISFTQLLAIFFQAHNPTTLNRQGGDVGTQYRSVIFYHNENQKQIAEKIKAKLNAEKAFEQPIVTEITAYTNFYPAEDYHKDYFELHGEQPYCTAIIRPKVAKMKQIFAKIYNTK